ncbi:MAG: metallophosphoesterase [Clostridia bacterium]|nr:metallophosphoesterase [Clostridia bacterium]
MNMSKIGIFVKDLIATVVILLTMLSPFSDKTGVAYEAENAEKLVMSMSVVSDVHIEKLNPTSYQYFFEILKNIKAGKDIDAVAYLGDNVMNGQLIENILFYNAVKAVNPSDNQYVIVGNHDHGLGERSYKASCNDFIANNRLYLDNNIDKTYYYKIVNGCYIIALASEDETAQGFQMSEIISGYDDAVASFNSERERNEEQARLLRQEQKLDLERKRAQRRLKK